MTQKIFNKTKLGGKTIKSSPISPLRSQWWCCTSVSKWYWKRCVGEFGLHSFLFFFLIFGFLWILLEFPFEVHCFLTCVTSQKNSREGIFGAVKNDTQKLRFLYFPQIAGYKWNNISTSSSFSFLYKKKTASLNQENPIMVTTNIFSHQCPPINYLNCD